MIPSPPLTGTCQWQVHMFLLRPWSLVLAIVCLSLTLASCGNSSSSGNHITQQQPIFTSAPPSAAAQGIAYSYQAAATDPAGGTITYALTIRDRRVIRQFSQPTRTGRAPQAWDLSVRSLEVTRSHLT